MVADEIRTSQVYQRKFIEVVESMSELVEALRDVEFNRALDVGCGSGKLVRDISRCTQKFVIGLDSNVEKLSHCEGKACFVAGKAEALPFKDDSFEVVLSSFAVHEFDDQQYGICEMLRVLKPGGLLICLDWVKGAPVVPSQKPLTPSAMKSMLINAGFVEVSVKPLADKRMLAKARAPM